MQNVVCLTKFAVLPKMYEALSLKQLTTEELDRLQSEPILYSPFDTVMIRVKDTNISLHQFSSFNPLLHTPNLYVELAKIQNEKDLMKFIEIYGLPLGISKSTSTNCMEELITITEMDTLDFFEELAQFSDLLSLWYYILNNEPIQRNFSFIVDGKVVSTETKDPKQIIATVLNSKRSWTESIESYGEKISLCIRFKNLFEVAYFQLMNAVLNKKPLRRCKECNSIFEVVHESQKFCAPRFGRKRSTCENTYRVRKRRKRQKEKITESNSQEESGMK